jgi:hypothetical protein
MVKNMHDENVTTEHDISTAVSGVGIAINNTDAAIVGVRFTGNFTKGVQFGTAATPITLNTAGQRGIDLYISTTALSDTTYGIYALVNTLAAVNEAIGGRFKTLVSILGAANAHGAHATLELDTSAGTVTGLGTGLRGNLVVANRAIGTGTYYGVMAEIYPNGASAAIPAGSNACLGINARPGTAMDSVVNAISFSGTAAKGKMIYAVAPTTIGGSIRILVNGAINYLPYYTTEGA